MLVIRVFWLQATLAVAALDLNGPLGGRNAPNSSAVESPPASNTLPGKGILDGLVGKGAAAPAKNGLLDGLLEPIVGPSGLLGKANGAAAPATSGEPERPPPAQSAGTSPATSAAETKAPPPPTVEPKPTTSASPVTEKAPPASSTTVPAKQPSTGGQNQQQPVPVAAPAPGTSSAPGQAPVSTVPSASQGVIPVSTPGPAPSLSGQSTSAGPATSTAGPASQSVSPIPTETARSSISTLVTAGGSTSMSDFVPPSPTGAVAAVDGSGANTDANRPNSTPNSTTGLDEKPKADPSTQTGGGGTNDNQKPQGATVGATQGRDGLPLPTKIGIGVGAGAGTILLVVLIMVVLWRRRMRGRYYADSEGRHTPTTPEEKQKLDWESEHDVAWDFGAFLKGRARGESRLSARGLRMSMGRRWTGLGLASARGDNRNMGQDLGRLPVYEPSRQPRIPELP